MSKIGSKTLVYCWDCNARIQKKEINRYCRETHDYGPQNFVRWWIPILKTFIFESHNYDAQNQNARPDEDEETINEDNDMGIEEQTHKNEVDEELHIEETNDETKPIEIEIEIQASRVRQRTLFEYEIQMSKLKNEIQRLISDIEDDEKKLHLTKIKEALNGICMLESDMKRKLKKLKEVRIQIEDTKKLCREMMQEF